MFGTVQVKITQLDSKIEPKGQYLSLNNNPVDEKSLYY